MTAQAQIIPINQETELEMKTLTLYEKATSLIITDNDSYIAAAEVGKGLKALEKEITEYHEPLRVAAKASYDAVLKRKNDDLAPVIEASGIVRKTVNTYIQEQDRIRKEEECKAQIKADEDARKERERLEAQALKAIESGKESKAESLMEKAENVYAAPVTVAPTVNKTVHTASGNITQAKELQITVTDIKLFVTELVKQNSAMTMISVGAGPLKSWVKSNGIKTFPGLSINETVSARF